MQNFFGSSIYGIVKQQIAVIMLFAGMMAFGAIICAQAQAGSRSAEGDMPHIENSAALQFKLKPYEENLAGTPGYKAKIDLLETESALYPHAAEIGAYISGQALDSLFSTRAESIAADLSDFCHETGRDAGNEEHDCANELGMNIRSAETVGSVASIYYYYFYFPVGAAHPMHAISTYNFALKPLFRIESLASLFENETAALPIVRDKIRQILMAQRDDEGNVLLNKDTVWEGTENWRDFDTFIITKSGIKVLFPPYAVAAYAFGAQEAELPYADLKGDAALKPFFSAALAL